jgi:2,3-bisphosphoglycerate-dependent phosphoglycerate mutase
MEPISGGVADGSCLTDAMTYLYGVNQIISRMPLLALVRHGQSSYNLENRFTGELDVPLTEKGREEAITAGKKLKAIPLSHGFTSLLQRAIDTMILILQETGHTDLPVTHDKALNERNYGQLQGLNKAEVARQYGETQVGIWRRSFSIRPPGGESLEDTAARVIPYYQRMIEPMLLEGQPILVVAHGNSLRALMMRLEGIGPDEIAHVDLPTGTPRLYSLDQHLHLEKVEYL